MHTQASGELDALDWVDDVLPGGDKAAMLKRDPTCVWPLLLPQRRFRGTNVPAGAPHSVPSPRAHRRRLSFVSREAAVEGLARLRAILPAQVLCQFALSRSSALLPARRSEAEIRRRRRTV